jgi:Baseplate J-like protein
MTCSDSNTACACGCCAGVEVTTPRIVWNPPGLPAVRWRVGEHADFLQTLLNRIAAVPVDIDTGEIGPHGRMRVERLYPLRALRTRSSDDPTIALLDGWSTLADVLSFYTERIANEGFLRTATELRSVIELARLVAYRRRPGVSASVFLAFTADETWKDSEPMIVPAGARVQSMPDPNQLPVMFETDAPLPALPQWNILNPRQKRPLFLSFTRSKDFGVLYAQGTSTNLTTNQAILFLFGDKHGQQVPRLIAKVMPEFDTDRTRVDLVGAPEVATPIGLPVDLDAVITQLERRPSIPPRSPAQLALSPKQTFGAGATASDGLLLAFHPFAAKTFFQARANAQVAPPSDLQTVLAMRVKASAYAHTAPTRMKTLESGEVVSIGEWNLIEAGGHLGHFELPPRLRQLDLDTTYEAILPDTWVVVERPARPKLGDQPARPRQQLITKVVEVQTVGRTDYNFPAKVTRLVLRDAWLTKKDTLLSDVRSTVVYAAPDPLALTDIPVDDPICGQEIELDRQIDGLQPGRWLIVAGERTAAPKPTGAEEAAGGDLPTPGVMESEIVMLSGVRQDTLYVADEQIVSPAASEKHPKLPGDKIHTFLQLSAPLAYCYKRSTVVIYGNVAHATHGETRREPLGSGNAAQTFQTFTLKNAALTYVSDPNPSGIDSTLKVYVNDVRWHEAENLLDLGPTDHGYLTAADVDEKTGVTFGDGSNGARLPNGIENVRAVYRSGIGAGGNVRAQQLTQLVANTDGLKSVINPKPASGGANAEALTSIRARAPLAVSALDRLVGTIDYADFARLFAGVAKASASRLASPHGQVVQVTVAGEDDIPIEVTSDLYGHLLVALERYGDPYLPIRLLRRELLLIVIAARIRLHPDYLWESVRPRLEAALFERFGFDQRQLGQNAYAAEAIAAMQAVPGVQYVDLDLFDAVSETIPPHQLDTLGTTLTGVKDRIPALPDRIDPMTGQPRPAQLVVLSQSLSTLLMLTEVPND